MVINMILKRLTSTILSLALFATSMTAMPTLTYANTQIEIEEDKPAIIKDLTAQEQEEAVGFLITFKDGERIMGTSSTSNGSPVTSVPNTSKPNELFSGWYMDENFTEKFYAEDIVTSNLTVYAKYVPMEAEVEEQTDFSFSMTDVAENFTFKVKKLSTATLSPSEAIIITDIDNGGGMGLSFSQVGEVITVSGVDAYRNGGDYQINLGEGYIFVSANGEEHPETTTRMNFSIAVEEQNNFMFGRRVVELIRSDVSAFTLNGSALSFDNYDTAGVVLDANGQPVMESETEVGTITLSSNNDEVEVGSLLAVSHSQSTIANDPTAKYSYFKITKYDPATRIAEWKTLDAEDIQDVFFVPQVVTVSLNPDNALLNAKPQTTSSLIIDLTSNSGYVIDEISRQNYKLDDIDEIYVNDILMLYTGILDEDYVSDSLRVASTVYARITKVTPVAGDTGKVEIEYLVYEKDELDDYYDSYGEDEVDSSEILDSIDKDAVVKAIEDDIRDSELMPIFEEQAMLTGLAIPEVQAELGITDADLFDADGKPLTSTQVLSNSRSSMTKFGISDIDFEVDIMNTNEVPTSPVKNGTRITVDFYANISISPDNSLPEGSTGLKNSAVFRIEVTMQIIQDIKVDFDASIDYDWGVFFFDELNVIGEFELQNFTSINFSVHMRSFKGGSGLTSALMAVVTDKATEQLDLATESYRQMQQEGLSPTEYAELEKAGEQHLENAKEALLSDDPDFDENFISTLESMSLAEFGELDYNETVVVDTLEEIVNNGDKPYTQVLMDDLMEQYSDIIQSETRWAELFRQELFALNFFFYGISFELTFTFIVTTKINIALGFSYDYQVGKKFIYVWDVLDGETYSNEIDLLDEKHAFEFYVMGTIGLRVGIEIAGMVGLLSADLAAVGIYAEVGAYIELWGYYIYTYYEEREANTQIVTSESQSVGAMYMELGIYFDLGFRANLLKDTIRYDKVLYEETWPLLTVGDQKEIFGFEYYPDAERQLNLIDNSAHDDEILWDMEDIFYTMKSIDLVTGEIESTKYSGKNFTVEFSNRYFSIDDDNEVVSVDPLDNVRYLETDMTITWVKSQQALTNQELSITVPVVWNNLTEQEYSEPLTVNVLIDDGYEQKVVYSDLVFASEEFSLPSYEVILFLSRYHIYDINIANLGIINAKYQSAPGYRIGNENVESLTALIDTNYIFELEPREYEIDVQTISGTQTFNALYGDVVDFNGAFMGTGENGPDTYSSYARVVAKDLSGNVLSRDLSLPIDKYFAESILSGSEVYEAIYNDETSQIVINYEGLGQELTREFTARYGYVPDMDDIMTDEIQKLVDDGEFKLVSITPDLASRNSPIISYTITFEKEIPTRELEFVATDIYNATTNSREDIDLGSGVYTKGTIVYPNVSIPGYVPKDGSLVWYTDEELTTAFDPETMMDGETALMLYAGVEPFSVKLDIDGLVDTTDGLLVFGEQMGKYDGDGNIRDTVSFPKAPDTTGYYQTGEWYYEDSFGTKIFVDPTDVFELTSYPSATMIVKPELEALKTYSVERIDSDVVQSVFFDEITGVLDKTYTVSTGETSEVIGGTSEIIGDTGHLKGTLSNGDAYEIFFKADNTVHTGVTDWINSVLPSQVGTYDSKIVITPKEGSQYEEFAQTWNDVIWIAPQPVFYLNGLEAEIISSGPNLFTKITRDANKGIDQSNTDVPLEPNDELIYEYRYFVDFNGVFKTYIGDWQDSPVLELGYGNSDSIGVEIRIDNDRTRNYYGRDTAVKVINDLAGTDSLNSQNNGELNLKPWIVFDVTEGSDDNFGAKLGYGDDDVLPDPGVFDEWKETGGSQLNYNWVTNDWFKMEPGNYNPYDLVLKEYVSGDSGALQDVLLEPWMLSSVDIWQKRDGSSGNNIMYDEIEIAFSDQYDAKVVDPDDAYNNYIKYEDDVVAFNLQGEGEMNSIDHANENPQIQIDIWGTSLQDQFMRDVTFDQDDTSHLIESYSDGVYTYDFIGVDSNFDYHNPFQYSHAPTISVEVKGGTTYQQFVSYNDISEISIEIEKASELMKVMGVPEGGYLDFTVTLEFPAQTTKNGTTFDIDTLRVYTDGSYEVVAN